jgi:competence transcription factor ComK
MKRFNDLDVRIQMVIIVLPLIALFIFAHYQHRNEPYWMETRYVKVIKVDNHETIYRIKYER